MPYFNHPICVKYLTSLFLGVSPSHPTDDRGSCQIFGIEIDNTNVKSCEDSHVNFTNQYPPLDGRNHLHHLLDNQSDTGETSFKEILDKTKRHKVDGYLTDDQPVPKDQLINIINTIRVQMDAKLVLALSMETRSEMDVPTSMHMIDLLEVPQTQISVIRQIYGMPHQIMTFLRKTHLSIGSSPRQPRPMVLTKRW